MSPPDITVLTDLCPHNKINKHSLSLSLFCSSSLLSSLPPSLSLILALLPRLPYSLLLHIPRRSCRLWISLSLSFRIQTKENPSDFHTSVSRSLTDTQTHTPLTFAHSCFPRLTRVLLLFVSLTVGLSPSYMQTHSSISQTEKQ